MKIVQNNSKVAGSVRESFRFALQVDNCSHQVRSVLEDCVHRCSDVAINAKSNDVAWRETERQTWKKTNDTSMESVPLYPNGSCSFYGCLTIILAVDKHSSQLDSFGWELWHNYEAPRV